MQILATRRFVEQAPASAGRVLDRLNALPRPREAPEEPRVARVGDDLALGYSLGPRQLKLWFVQDLRSLGVPGRPPLATMPRADLLAMGLDRDLVSRVQGLTRLDQLEALVIDEDARARLRMRFVQVAAGCRAREEDLTRRAESAGQLLDFLNGRLSDLLLNLDPTQQRVVDLRAGGNIVVKGVAGSGKTSVALHRIRRLCQQGTLWQPRTILLVTYNRSLSSAARELLDDLGGEATAAVEVKTLHRWCMDLASVSSAQVMKEREQARCLERAVERGREAGRGSALWGYPTSFWAEEVHLIKSRVLGGRSEYLTMKRRGARRALQAQLRELVWGVYEAYQRSCRQASRLDWDDVVRLAHRRMVRLGDAAPRYDHVFVDEAQDLTLLALRLAGLLARTPGELYIGYDLAQSIYERGVRPKDAGVTVHGARSFALCQNYRNTRQLLEAARPLLDGVHQEHARQGSDQEDLLLPEASARTGAWPTHLDCHRGQEARAITQKIRDLLETGTVRPGNIAVLAYPNYLKKGVFNYMKGQGLACQMHGRAQEVKLRSEEIKVLSMHSAKGLEFPVVFLIATGRWFGEPRELEGREEGKGWREEMRRVFYVAMTRAMSQLYLVYPKQDPVAFLDPVRQDRPQGAPPAPTAVWMSRTQLYAAASDLGGRFERSGPLVGFRFNRRRGARAADFVALFQPTELVSDEQKGPDVRLIYLKDKENYKALVGKTKGDKTQSEPAADPRATEAPAARSDAVPGAEKAGRPKTETEVVAQGNRKFHRPTCEWLKQREALRRYPDRKDALAQGLQPCNTCKP